MYIIAVGLQIFAIALLFASLILLMRGDGSREHKFMAYFAMGSLLQNIAYLLELTATTAEVAITAVKLEYMGSTFVPVLYCWFIFSYCNVKAPNKLLTTLVAVDTAIIGIVFTCDHNRYFYESITWVEDSDFHPYLYVTYGPVFYLFILVSCGVPFFLSFYALVRGIFSRYYRIQRGSYKLFLLLSLTPVVALISYVIKIFPEFDYTPFVMGISLGLMIIFIWGRRNYDFSRQAAEVVLRNMDDGVIMLDEKRRIVSYNNAASDIFTELSFQTMGASIDDVEDFPQNILDESVKGAFCLNNKYYESHVKQILSPIKKNKGYVVLILDVTETRNYIEEIKTVREQAEQANVAKSEFLANMSHEIRTPMNAIIGLSDIIMEESRGRKVYGYAYDIRSASQNLLNIINDILDLSKVEAGKMELVMSEYYVKSMVSEIVNMMGITATQRGLKLQCEYDESIPCRYCGDDGRIKQILINITNNAIKFTKEGYVRISVGGHPGETEELQMLTFRIEDTGCGIKQENLEKIFEDFKQVDSKRNRGVEGTGLGLSITKQLVKLMKGTLEVSSVYGEGTVFTVSIPQKIVDYRPLSEMPEVPEKVVEKVEAFEVKDYKVLIVDDNLINRKVAIGFLKNYGFDLMEAASGKEAIELVKKNKFNLIFMDHMMPEMDGIETVKIIREECGDNGRSPVIIALTANAMEGVREKFLQNGFQDFVAKPLDRKPLNDILDRWIPGSYRKLRKENEDISKKEKLVFEDIYIQGIDIEEAKKHHTGEVEDYLELLDLYCIDGKRKCSLLRDLIGKEDYHDYEIEVHGLKSASANIGAMELSTQAREHEEAAVRGDIEFIHRHFDDLLACYDRQLDEIQKFLDSRLKSNDMGSGDEAYADRKTILKEAREALEHLEEFKSKECAAIVERMLGYRLETEIFKSLKEIQQQLKMYEDDIAEDLLRKLCSGLEKGD